MEQHAEAFPQERVEPKKKRDAIILPFKPREKESAGGEKGQGYEKYKALGGILSPEEYQDVLKRAADGALSSSKWSAYAQSMGRVAGITLSPETVSIYGILRDGQDERYSGMSDQKLLAEALCISEGTSFLTKFRKEYPHIFH